jgi:hypothetical protein
MAAQIPARTLVWALLLGKMLRVPSLGVETADGAWAWSAMTPFRTSSRCVGEAGQGLRGRVHRPGWDRSGRSASASCVQGNGWGHKCHQRSRSRFDCDRQRTASSGCWRAVSWPWGAAATTSCAVRQCPVSPPLPLELSHELLRFRCPPTAPSAQCACSVPALPRRRQSLRGLLADQFLPEPPPSSSKSWAIETDAKNSPRLPLYCHRIQPPPHRPRSPRAYDTS